VRKISLFISFFTSFFMNKFYCADILTSKSIPVLFSFYAGEMDPTNGVTLGVTIDSAAVDEQLEVWAASRANFGLNCDQNMDPKKAMRYVIWLDIFLCYFQF
jgi:hypothetical protein